MQRRLQAVAVTWLFCVTVFLFAGCRKQSAAPPVTTDFSCDFTARYGEMQAKGTLTRYTAGTLQLAFSYPDTLQDVVVVWDGEAVEVRYHDMTFQVTPSALPESALGEMVIRVLDEVASGGGTTTESGDTVTVSGSQNGIEYTYEYDTKSGAPRSLSVPSYGLTVTFTTEEG